MDEAAKRKKKKENISTTIKLVLLKLQNPNTKLLINNMYQITKQQKSPIFI